jgi:2-isopropylmalate synthase
LPELVEVYDTTLRDGNQSVGVNFTSTQKLRIAKALIAAQVDYVEGGWPNETNPADLEFFQLAKRLDRSQFSHVAAFGMTRRANMNPAADQNLHQLLDTDTEIVTIFGKSWTFQVERILGTTLSENGKMIHDSVKFLRSHGRKVIYDAEHFFDGFKADPEYALSTLKTAEDAGASMLVLCDTRGASCPTEVYEVTSHVVRQVSTRVGIHAHNDRGMATANALFAVIGGASHIQGTMNGLGERVGNADLIEVVANLHLMGIKTRLQASKLTALSRFTYEMSGLREDPFKPFVGKYAFAHKGGVHGDAVLKAERAYEFFDPAAFGNARAITVSSQAGRSSLLSAAEKFGFHLSKNDIRVAALLRKVKRLEALGCNLEFAEASIELLFLRALTQKRDPFRIIEWEATASNAVGKTSARCTLRVDVDGTILETHANGNGPVNALDEGLRVVLKRIFGSRFSAMLSGYRVRETDSEAATAARVAVYIDFSDGHRTWTTVASSTNIMQASLDALVDGYAYALRTSSLQTEL